MCGLAVVAQRGAYSAGAYRAQSPRRPNSAHKFHKEPVCAWVAWKGSHKRHAQMRLVIIEAT